ncbi:unnamed protein product [Ectocarpus sp. CCAP 1310/34]|nr:unnamed protein product [Ectocarpus sp. CCAP 1310/34]
MVESGLIPSQLCRLLDILDRAEGGILSLEDNPWAEPLESIVTKGPKSIRGYFEVLYAEPCRLQRSSVNVILVGQEGAGNTSLCQSMKANEATSTGDWKEESTVFADVEPMELEGSSVRLYDCAGQAAYTGLLQMFMTPRSVCVLMCNVEAFGQRRGRDTGGQISENCRKLEELQVCEWLRLVSRRVPDNDAILVATKCDLVCGNAPEPVRLEHGVGLTSCRPTGVREHGERRAANHTLEGGWVCDWRGHVDDASAPSLLHRLVNKPAGGGLRGTQLVLPRSWDIALTVLEALEIGRTWGGADEDIIAKWLETVDELARREITVTSAKNREFDGSLVRRETSVFLDVVWLVRILKPLLNRKDEETFDGLVNRGDTGNTRVTLEDPLDIDSWGRLKNEGVLEPRLACALWPDGLSEHVLPTLASSGLTFPLENDPAEGLVVLLRQKSDCPESVGKVINTFFLEHIPAFSASWKTFLGVPPGTIEKMFTRCCNLGGGWHDMFAVALEYSFASNEPTANIFGDISTPSPWMALSYVMSAVSLMMRDFPGLRSRGSLKCPQHGDAMLLATKVTRPGDKFLEGSGCPQCSADTRGLEAAAIDLVRMFDIRFDRGVQHSFKEEDLLIQKIDGVAIAVQGGFNEMEGEVDGIMGRLDNVLENTQESLMRLKNLQAPNYLYPRLAAVEEVASGSTPSRAHGMKRVLSKLRGVEKKEMMLHFLGPVDMTKVPCGYGGEGYWFWETRGWVKKISTVLQDLFLLSLTS